ncbi:LysR family transcriptional regulator [Cohnella xylanilytica]|uniref:LysR family transcriptional regulator n=1 Tax=Cohnella xylanilytica TaxID=557555 RepID=A0A841U3F2_9BACL|nr:LysR family transcriptional regulator [Cohnella xylanilytica]MBB6693668.1 LysR family transcriptional regulator [Cohnella xylanilytica]
MHIEFIHSFLVTAECGSIARASEKLSLTHPALSKQLRSLEAYYGTLLFRRSPGGVELTEAGRRLRERVRPLYEEWQSIRQELADANGPRRIRLGALPSLAAHYLPPRMPGAEGLGLAIEPVVAPTSDELRGLLQAGAVDAVLCEPSAAALPPSRPAVWSASLFEEPFCLVAHREHLLAREASVGVAQLRDQPLVLHPPGCGIRRLFAGLCRAHGFEPTIKVEANFGDFLLGYVAAGSGLTLVPRLVAESLRHPDLVAVPIREEGAKRQIVLAAARRETGRALLPALQPS